MESFLAKSSMTIILLLLIASAFPIESRAGSPGWLKSLLKLRALVSDRNTVESSFKKIKVIESYKNGELEVVNYKLKQGRLRVVYSGGDCGNYYDYRVAKGTVIDASIFVSDGLRLSERNLKFNRNEMTLFVDDGGTEQYTDESNGIGYGIQRGLLDNIVIKPRKIDAGARCDAVEDRK